MEVVIAERGRREHVQHIYVYVIYVCICVCCYHHYYELNAAAPAAVERFSSKSKYSIASLN